MFQYTLGVTVLGVEFFRDFETEAGALEFYDSLVADPDAEIENDYACVPARDAIAVTEISLRRVFVPIQIGQPNR
jgi:hypothetical protein